MALNPDFNPLEELELLYSQTPSQSRARHRKNKHKRSTSHLSESSYSYSRPYRTYDDSSHINDRKSAARSRRKSRKKRKSRQGNPQLGNYLGRISDKEIDSLLLLEPTTPKSVYGDSDFLHFGTYDPLVNLADIYGIHTRSLSGVTEEETITSLSISKTRECESSSSNLNTPVSPKNNPFKFIVTPADADDDSSNPWANVVGLYT